MGKANKLSHPEIREKLTSSILHLLASLPEIHRNIFVWKHYYGWPESQIASRLGWSSAEVENTLYEISRTIMQRAEAILLESIKLEETDQPGLPVEIGENALENVGPLVTSRMAGPRGGDESGDEISGGAPGSRGWNTPSPSAG